MIHHPHLASPIEGEELFLVTPHESGGNFLSFPLAESIPYNEFPRVCHEGGGNFSPFLPVKGQELSLHLISVHIHRFLAVAAPLRTAEEIEAAMGTCVASFLLLHPPLGAEFLPGRH